MKFHMFVKGIHERRTKMGKSWKDENQNRLTTRLLARIERGKPLWLNGFVFFRIHLNKQGGVRRGAGAPPRAARGVRGRRSPPSRRAPTENSP